MSLRTAIKQEAKFDIVQKAEECVKKTDEECDAISTLSLLPRVERVTLQDITPEIAAAFFGFGNDAVSVENETISDENSGGGTSGSFAVKKSRKKIRKCTRVKPQTARNVAAEECDSAITTQSADAPPKKRRRASKMSDSGTNATASASDAALELHDTIYDPVRDPLHDPLCDPVRDPLCEPVRDPLCDPVYDDYAVCKREQSVLQIQRVPAVYRHFFRPQWCAHTPMSVRTDMSANAFVHAMRPHTEIVVLKNTIWEPIATMIVDAARKHPLYPISIANQPPGSSRRSLLFVLRRLCILIAFYDKLQAHYAQFEDAEARLQQHLDALLDHGVKRMELRVPKALRAAAALS